MISRAQIDAVTSFVTQRPDDDRGIVLAAFQHALRAIEVVRHPVRLVTQRLVMVVAVAMTFDVCLVYDIETILAR